MTWSWIDLAFPWIGGAAAIVLLALLFGTHLLRSEPGLSKWKDRVWLSWLALVIYLLHNVEEYGIDLFGRLHEFPGSICATLKFPAYPDCRDPARVFPGSQHFFDLDCRPDRSLAEPPPPTCWTFALQHYFC